MLKRAIVTALVLLASPAAAQTCMGLADARAMLLERYGEVSVGYGLAGGDHVVEIYVSKTGSFSVVAVDANSMACLLATGEGWVFVEEPWPSEGVDG